MKRLKKVLRIENIIPELSASNKAEVMDELIDLLMQNRDLPDRQIAIDAIWRREKLMSTGLQNGVATPHAKISGIDSLRASIGVKHEGIDFASMDGKPSKIFIMLFSPVDVRGPHVQFLADIATLLSEEKLRLDLLSRGTKEAILDFFTGTT